MRIFKEPLLHFVLAGGLLFAVYTWLNPDVVDQPNVVRITAAEVEWLKATWSRRWSRQPDNQELRGLVSAHLREKLLAREARELGLELDDTVVRRRLAQKMEFLIQDVAALGQPNESELRKFYEQDHARYQRPARVSFTQIFFREESSAQEALVTVSDRNASNLGDRSLLPRDFSLADERTITNVFGPGFSGSVFNLETGNWQGPFQSSYGYHLLKITEHQSAQQPSIEEVRDQLIADWQQAQREKTEQQYYDDLLRKYEVVLDKEVTSLLGSLTDGAIR